MTWTARNRPVKARGHLLAWPRCGRDSEELLRNDQMGGKVGSILPPKDLEQVPPRYTSMTSGMRGRAVLGRMSKRGGEYLRTLLI